MKKKIFPKAGQDGVFTVVTLSAATVEGEYAVFSEMESAWRHTR